MKALARSSDLTSVMKALRPRDMSSRLKLAPRPPRVTEQDCNELDREMILAHEKRTAAYKAVHPSVQHSLQEQAKAHLKRALQIDTFMRRAGCRGCSVAELEALGRFVNG